jgi:hypothetical protein
MALWSEGYFEDSIVRAGEHPVMRSRLYSRTTGKVAEGRQDRTLRAE